MTRASLRGGGTRSPTDIDIAVGANLRAVRLQRGRTLSDLAAELGISHQQLQKYETGTNRLSAGMVCRAAEVLVVPIEQLFRIETDRVARKRLRKDRALEVLKEEGTYYLERAGSVETLAQMVQVLKVLSASA